MTLVFSSLLFSLFLSQGVSQHTVHTVDEGLYTLATAGQADRIILDGQFDDWQGLTPAYSDAAGDTPGGQVDFGQIWITNDEDYLFLHFELGAEVLLQDVNEICLYLDTDDDPTTGLAVQGIGAELFWTFGNREGTFYVDGSEVAIEQGVLGIVSAPTISGTLFEVAFPRNAMPDGQNLLFEHTAIRLVMWDLQGDDILPDVPGGVAYTFDDTTVLPPLAAKSLKKQDASDVRFLSYNVEFDALFDSSKQPAFVRMLRAMSPDIIGFQEILSHTAEETRAVVESAIPLPVGQQWYAARSGPDLVVVSRYPVLETYVIQGWSPGDSNAAFLLDMQDTWGTELLLVVAHPPCCRNENGRQLDIDAIMAFVRDAKAEGGVLDLVPETPIVILGDMNLVGFKEQQRTLLTGDIVNSDRFGEAFSPDWDGTALTDLSPRSLSAPMTFTWYREASSFHPGRLDYIVYSDAVLEAQNNYVLFTPAMPADSLAAYQLEAGDATLASDHLPVVGDFQYKTSTGTRSEQHMIEKAVDLHMYPNPFNNQLTITINTHTVVSAKLVLYNALGQEIGTLLDRTLAKGTFDVAWDASQEELPTGLYFVRFQVGGQVYTKPVVRMAR